MTEKGKDVLPKALELPPLERAELIEGLLESFEFRGRSDIDKRWAAESEDRIDAYERGELRATPADEVFDKLSKK